MSDPPPARVEVVQDTHHGVPVDDPYRWMEAETGEFDAWLAAQSTHAREVLEALPTRASLLARLSGRSDTGMSWRRLGFAGDRAFALSDALVVRSTVDRTSVDRILVDPSAIAGPAHSFIDFYQPSPSGQLVVSALSVGGAETCTLRVTTVDTGETVEEAIDNVRLPYLSWIDDQSFLYHRYPDPAPDVPPDARRMDSRSYLHRVGDDPSHDRVVLARGLCDRLPLQPADRPLCYHRPGTGWVLAIISHSALAGDRVDEGLSDCTLYAAPLADLYDPATCPWFPVADPADGVVSFAVGADTLYLVAHRDAPHRRVLAVPLPSSARAAVVVPESDRIIQAVKLVGDRLLIRETDAGTGRLRQLTLPDGEAVDVPLPVEGSIRDWVPTADECAVMLTIESWTAAPRIYGLDLDSGDVTDAGWTAPDRDDRPVSVRREYATARDGTRIPVTILHPPGAPRDGSNPTMLTAYGAYGFPFTPAFRSLPAVTAWLEHGGIWAAAHVRGGGEYGASWHAAGRKLNKENTITDFIDCAEYLVESGYTSAARLAGIGGSAGAIPVGGAMVRRPDLFGAIVLNVPLLDTLRAETGENGPINVPELGSVTTEEGFRALTIIDSYRRVQDGTHYPSVLLTAGRNDSRVPAWQAAKMAARLQAATSSGKPVLLRVEWQGGHGGIGATAEQTNALLADALAFMLDALQR